MSTDCVLDKPLTPTEYDQPNQLKLRSVTDAGEEKGVLA